jgi:hypothetical protein
VNAERLRNVLATRPFRPFTMNLADGRKFRVDHPELVAVFPGMDRTAILAFPKKDAIEIIDLLLVSSLSVVEGETKPRRRKAG